MNIRKLFFLILGLAAAVSLPSFLRHVEFFFSGQISFFMKQNAWLLVLGSIVFFLVFLIPFGFRRKAEWAGAGIYTAFIISLFIEMYGLPLTVYLSSAVVSMDSSASIPGFIFSFLGFSVNLWMIIGLLLTGIGCVLVAVGWHRIYRSDGMADSGIYSYSRHPQYLGIILISAGWFIGWPTPLTALLLPVLIFQYYKLSIQEEEEALEEFGENYRKYMSETPRFI